MSDQPTALRLADELLDGMGDEYWNLLNADAAAELRRLHAEVERLRAALAEPEQEPVAWIEHGLVEAHDGLAWGKGEVGKYTPLYTAPPPRKPVELTDDDLWALWDHHHADTPSYDRPSFELSLYRAVIAAYEAKQRGQK